MNSDEKHTEGLNSVLKKITDRIKKDKKSMLVIALGISGMLIILFSGTNETTDDTAVDINCNTYAEDIVLKQVEELISEINGVGKAEVVITYENDFETVYAANSNEKYTGDDVHIDREYIITDDETGLIIKTVYPKVRGVAVVCQGGDEPVVKEKIYSALSALFDISSNKISVVDMK